MRAPLYIGAAALLVLGTALASTRLPTFGADESRQHGMRERSRFEETDRDAKSQAARERYANARHEESEEENRNPDLPDGIMQMRRDMRADESGQVPMGAIVRAKSILDERRKALPPEPEGSDAADGGIWNWTWLGPGNIGGRVRTILPHPTISGRIFIGSVAGGIWRTDNSGASWTPVADFMTSLAVSSLVMDPGNSNVMYAGTGEGFYNFDALPGAGIFKSTNGGTTWNQLPSTNNSTFRYVNRLAHHPTTSNLLYAACGYSNTVQRSTNGGTSWTEALLTDSPVGDVKIQPTNGSRIAAGCLVSSAGNDGAVWLSTNGGTDWTEQTVGGSKLPSSTGRCEVAFGSGNVLYALLNRNEGEVWRTTNMGSTWSLRSSPPLGTQLWYDNAIWVDPTNNDFVVVGGVDAFRSTNGGATFTRITDWTQYHLGFSAHADQHAFVPAANYNGTTVRTVYFANDGGIQRASNIATVAPTSGWTNLANGLGVTQFFKGAAAPNGSVIVGGTQDNDMLRYTGGGTESWYQAATGDGGACSVDPNDPSIIYRYSPPLWVGKSTDGGDTYFPASNGIEDTNNALSVAPVVMDEVNSSILYAGGASIWRTTNAAASWSRRRSPVGADVFCSAIDAWGSEIWAGYTNGTVSRSTNNGVTWVNVDGNGPLPDRSVTDIEISPYFVGEALVTFGGYESDNVWFTSNFGATWTLRSGTPPFDIPELQVNTITYHPANPDWIYVGTDLGIFASETVGLTWNVTPAHGDHDGPANVEVDDLLWHGPFLVAVTHGRGMYRCRPLDVVWVDIANGGAEDGTQQRPYDTIGEGIAASGHGTTLSVRTGTYTEGAVLFDRRGVTNATGGTVVVR